MNRATDQNHYQVLALERTADERAVKKAYFALVRKFPPDRHPEEFKKIRAAYEVLSDPVARARFDAADRDFAEYGETVGATLRAATEAARTGNEVTARQYLETLISQKPDLLVAREMLGQAYLRGENPEGARRQFDELVKARPEDGRYHLWRGYALAALKEKAGAERAFRQAHELRPDDVETRIALADALASQGMADEALAEFEKALKLLPPEPGPRLQIELRRLDVLFRSKDGNAALRELDAFVGRVRRDPDKEFWKLVSSQLGALAARLFAGSDFDHANAVLERCLRLNPGSLVEHPYPAEARLDLADLPEKSRRWLAGQKPGPNSPTLHLAAWGGSLWGLLASAGFATLVAYVFFSAPWSWGVAGYGFAFLGSMAAALALAACVRAIVAAIAAPMHPLVTIHPLYLIEAGARRLKVYPLVNLGAVNLTRHSTNGVYTHTAVQALFGKRKFRTSIRNEAYAQGWANHLIDTRRRLLDLLHHGFLEAEPDVDLLPPRLFRPRPKGKWAWLNKPDRYAIGGALAGLFVFALAIPWNRRLVEEVEFGAAARSGSAKAQAEYLRLHPRGRFVPWAREELSRRFAEARAGLDPTAGANPPFREAFLAGLQALEKQGEVGLPVLVSWEAAADAEAAGASDPALKAALAKSAHTRQAAALVQRLREVVAHSSLREVAPIEAPAAGATPRPLELRIEGRSGLEDTEFAGGPLALRGVRVSFLVTLVRKGETKPVEWRIDTGPPDRIVLDAAVSSTLPERGYAAELDGARAELLAHLTAAMGIGPGAPAPRATALAAGASPYLR
jgi:curved DNA-binding protein CbpA